MLQHPQNPYESFMVEASAGSGKTFQLSKRFLNLVASGAKPQEILTITFTVKAANEMRARIIVEATRLLDDASAQRTFDRAMLPLFLNAQAYWRQHGIEIPPPLRAQEVAASILACTQLLQISTIDALFKDWVSKFPWESAAEAGSQEQKIAQTQAHFSMVEAMDLEELNRKAWLRLFTKPDTKALLLQASDSLKTADTERGLLSIESRIYELFRLRTYLWHAEQTLADSAFCPHLPPSQPEELHSCQVIKSLQEPLQALARSTKRRELLEEAIAQGNLAALIELKLLTKSYEVHGGTIRGKNRETLAQSIHLIEETLGSFANRLCLQRLDHIGGICYQLYKAWMQEREQLKNQKNCVEFDDLSIASHRLLHGPAGVGVLWLIQKSIQHLLIDEFQDTSFLQWQIFARLAEELLAGKSSTEERGLLPTVFIVGDAKQSIYGFREADPEVLHHARAFLNKFQKNSLPLSHSYRSTQVVLDFVNRVFQGRNPQFASHQTARDSDHKPFIPDCGKVTVHELFTSDTASEAEPSAVEREANYVAYYLRQALSDPESHPVYCKSSKTFRPLDLGDCCILYRSATHASVFAKALRQQGLAYRREDQRGFFDRCEIQDTLAFLEVLLHPDEALSLLSVLKSPIFALSDLDILSLLEAAQTATAAHSASHQGLGLRLRTHLAHAQPEIAPILQELQTKTAVLLPHQLLTELYTKLHVLEKYQQAFLGVEGKIAKKNLIKLLELCTRLEDEGYVGLAQCLERLQELAQKSELASASFQSNVISLMTIHKAKGLEFPLVVVVGTGELWYKDERYWLKQNGRGVSFIGNKSQQPQTHPGFLSLLRRQQEEGEAESLRLLYVALTRASQYLLITGHKPHIFKKEAFLPALVALAQDSAKTCSPPWLLQTPGQGQAQGQAWYWQGSFTPTPQALSSSDKAPSASALAAPLTASRIPTPAQPLALPYELQIVQPQAQGGKLSTARDGLPPKLEAAIGSFVHAGLAAEASEQAWEPQRAWQSLVVPVAKKIRTYPLRLLPALFHSAMKTLQQNQAHPTWQALLASAPLRKANLPLVQLKGERLLRGHVDLYLERHDSIVLVTFKETTLDPQTREEDIYHFFAQQGLTQLLTTYARAVQELKPQHPVSAGIWLSREARFVKLVDKA